MTPQFRNRIMTPLALAVALGICAPVQADPAVGEVSLVLGSAFIERADGSRLAATAGTAVHASDQISTTANGHVHIRFIDEGLVSIRPDSRLEIVQYQYNPDQPAASSIKLNLQEGITRSISGRGASSARERFRMNTPIAAIGVRGTDFVVSATPYAVRALVNEGAIVMAPFSADCTADAFGPCASNAVELTDSAMQVIEMDGSSGPRMLPATLERDPDMMADEVNTAIADSESNADDKTVGTGVYLENVTSRRVKEEAVIASRGPDTPLTPPAIAEVDYTPASTLSVAELTDNNLLWGRWAAGQGDLERLTLPYPDAREGRDVTVGNDNYVLFRDGNGSTRVQAGLGPVSFALTNAQAFYHADSGVFAMAVNGGSLDINFDTNQFSTELNMNHELTGRVDFNANGRLFDGGYFHTRSATERMAGAVSIDGSEAGYFFEKQLEAGGIQGLTLWDSR